MYLDFDDIKRAVRIERVAEMLGLQMRKEPASLRCKCPVHGGDKRSLAISQHRGGAFYCTPSNGKGDCIELVCHIRGIKHREAAELIAKHFGLDTSSTAPAPRPELEEETAPPTAGMQPLDYLDPFHESVEELGITPMTADKVGIGYADKGTMKNRVLIPIRLEDGTLIGYCGIKLDDELPFKFPENLQDRAEGKVVPMRRKA